jgi:transposase
MSKQRRSFSPEFKRSAASLVLDQSYSHVDASRSVGVAESVLRRWVQQLHQERIQELEARVERLEREKIILKKATALLMSEGIERTK